MNAVQEVLTNGAERQLHHARELQKRKMFNMISAIHYLNERTIMQKNCINVTLNIEQNIMQKVLIAQR